MSMQFSYAREQTKMKTLAGWIPQNSAVRDFEKVFWDHGIT